MFDRLWSPFGLVRYGVAPDHPEVKVCVAFVNFDGFGGAFCSMADAFSFFISFRMLRINSMRRLKICGFGSLGM